MLIHSFHIHSQDLLTAFHDPQLLTCPQFIHRPAYRLVIDECARGRLLGASLRLVPFRLLPHLSKNFRSATTQPRQKISNKCAPTRGVDADCTVYVMARCHACLEPDINGSSL